MKSEMTRGLFAFPLLPLLAFCFLPSIHCQVPDESGGSLYILEDSDGRTAGNLFTNELLVFADPGVGLINKINYMEKGSKDIKTENVFGFHKGILPSKALAVRILESGIYKMTLSVYYPGKKLDQTQYLGINYDSDIETFLSKDKDYTLTFSIRYGKGINLENKVYFDMRIEEGKPSAIWFTTLKIVDAGLYPYDSASRINYYFEIDKEKERVAAEEKEKAIKKEKEEKRLAEVQKAGNDMADLFFTRSPANPASMAVAFNQSIDDGRLQIPRNLVPSEIEEINNNAINRIKNLIENKHKRPSFIIEATPFVNSFTHFTKAKNPILGAINIIPSILFVSINYSAIKDKSSMLSLVLMDSALLGIVGLVNSAVDGIVLNGRESKEKTKKLPEWDQVFEGYKSKLGQEN